jgi:transcriptional regulator with XRE-family HTH domain
MGKDQERLYEALGKAIRARREALDLTQSEVSDSVGMSRGSVTNIECGRQSLLVDQLYKFAEALKTTPTDLLPPPEPPAAARKTNELSPETNAWVNRMRRSVR